MLPASAFMLFRPTVAPARPCRVPREVREFMALALELAVVPAVGEGRKKREGGEEGGEERDKDRKERNRLVIQEFNKPQGSSSCRGVLIKYTLKYIIQLGLYRG